MPLVSFGHIPIHHRMRVCACPHTCVRDTSLLLALQNILGSSCVFCAAVLQIAISPRSPGSFYWKMVLNSKIQVLGVLIATEELLLLASGLFIILRVKDIRVCVFIIMVECTFFFF